MEPCLFIKSFIITSTLIVFILKLSQFWPKEALSSWFFCPFHVLPLDRWLSSKTLCPRIILYFLSPRSGIISLFSKEPWLLFLGNAFRNQDLTTKCTHCYQRIISRPFHLVELGNIYLKHNEFVVIFQNSLFQSIGIFLTALMLYFIYLFSNPENYSSQYLLFYFNIPHS